MNLKIELAGNSHRSSPLYRGRVVLSLSLLHCGKFRAGIVALLRPHLPAAFSGEGHSSGAKSHPILHPRFIVSFRCPQTPQ